MSQLIDSYLNLLPALGMTMDEETSGLRVFNGEEYLPVFTTIQRGDNTETLPMVMPTKAVQLQEEDGTTIKFHPLMESPFAAQSEVLNKTLMMGGNRVCVAVQGLVNLLIGISLDVDNHGSYSNDIMRLIEHMPSVKAEKSRENIRTYAAKVAAAHTGIRGAHPVVRFNIRRNVNVGDDSYLRYADLSTPVLDQDPETMRIFGVKAPSQAAYHTVMGAYESVLGNLKAGYGVNTQTAPSFLAFVGCLGNVCKHINTLARKLGKRARKDYHVDTKFLDIITNAEALAKELPVAFEGNVGSSSGKADDIRHGQEERSVRPAAVQVELKSPQSQVVDDDEPPFDVTEPTTSEPKPMSNTDDLLDRLPRLETPNHAADVATAQPAHRAPFGDFRKKPGSTEIRRQAPTQASAPQSAAVPVKKPAATVAPSPRPQSPQVHASRPTVTSASPSKVVVQHHKRQVHLHDSLGQPAFLRNGQPWMVNEDEVPRELFLIASDGYGNAQFDGEFPVLEGVTQQELEDIAYRNGLGGQAHYGQPHYDNHPARRRMVEQPGYGQPTYHNEPARSPYAPQQPQYPYNTNTGYLHR